MNRYPSDEELDLWIHNLEQEELYAPRHLKEEIMHKAFGSNQSSLPVSFLSYSAKMIAGMAAAVVLTFMIPASDGTDISRAQIRMERLQQENERREEKLAESLLQEECLNEKIPGQKGKRHDRKNINDAAEQLHDKIANLWNKETGGNE